MCRRTDEEVRHTFQSHRHFIGFNVPVQAPILGHPFYGYSEKSPNLIAFYDTLGIPKPFFIFNPGVNTDAFFMQEAKSRKYQGVFEVKSRVKTWQVRGIWSQQLEH